MFEPSFIQKFNREAIRREIDATTSRLSDIIGRLETKWDEVLLASSNGVFGQSGENPRLQAEHVEHVMSNQAKSFHHAFRDLREATHTLERALKELSNDNHVVGRTSSKNEFDRIFAEEKNLGIYEAMASEHSRY